MNRILALFALLGSLIAATPAAAWWEYGHETVASIAMAQVKPSTRAAIRKLLARSDLLETPTCPARTIEQASVWPDCVKPLGDRFSYAYNWHYQNVNICKPFAIKPNCPDGNCVSAQIERNARLLKDRTVPVRERVMALVFLVHFMGDLHQPLHAGDKADLGGNRVKAAYGVIEGRANLHSVWDGLLADRALSTPPGGAKGLLEEYGPPARAAMREGTVEDWSRENWQVARDSAYASVLGDPCAPTPDQRVKIDEATIEKLIPVLRLQAMRGGVRLARLLDEALG
ncbi:S1/P1 nuclease [Edaphosphingomonas haloaromaticamans]|uniref:S1/P1 Nuclease n=1 Tax=Edaphosphingomonas haloaromaticamans TaxID=653954 RepID=A0A1S1HAZ3_9SPHN|nr:S1/P1 nuclease [Sphingomonas haloaromaticamans]OHT18483.1 S1/P1 Nuclease [Sphingomonas haloaromaticamans]